MEHGWGSALDAFPAPAIALGGAREFGQSFPDVAFKSVAEGEETIAPDNGRVATSSRRVGRMPLAAPDLNT